MIHHLAFIHNDIDLDVQRCISNWPKDLRDNIVRRVDNFLIKKASQKRKNPDHPGEIAAKKSKEDLSSLDLTECDEEVLPKSFEDESVLRALFEKEHSGDKIKETPKNR